MNYFAHARPFLDRPYFMAGTAVPDWLTVADRKVRLRSKHAAPLLADADPLVVEVIAGGLQHLRDDAHFHETRAFVETCWELTGRVRDVLGGDPGMRPAFLGHLLTEVLLDAALIAEDADRLECYYRVLDEVDAARVEEAVNRAVPTPTRRLAVFIELFRRERVLWDYLEDGKLLVRLNQVMRRVRLPILPQEFMAILPTARDLVTSRSAALLDGIPTSPS